MKIGLGLTISTVVLAVVYGVIFSRIYPLVEIDGGIVALCVVLALATSLVAFAIVRWLRRNPSDKG